MHASTVIFSFLFQSFWSFIHWLQTTLWVCAISLKFLIIDLIYFIIIIVFLFLLFFSLMCAGYFLYFYISNEQELVLALFWFDLIIFFSYMYMYTEENKNHTAYHCMIFFKNEDFHMSGTLFEQLCTVLYDSILC